MSEEAVVEDSGVEDSVVEDSVVEAAPDEDDALLESLLVEEVSIDGMCGVY
jgi:mycofactocin precursor